jgi:hypothetical protein
MYCKVKVIPGAKKESFVKKSEDHFSISVREPAERNLANNRVLELVANHFKVPKGKVRLISGHRSPSKILRVD